SIRVTGHSARKTNNAPTPATRSMRPSQGLRARPCASWLSARDVRRLVARNGSVVSSLHCMNDPRPEGHMASYIERRKFLATFGGAAATWAMAARAQEQPAPPGIGYLGSGSPAEFAGRLRAFRQGLSEIGYIEGKNVAIEYRWAENQYDRFPALLADLVRRNVTVITAVTGTPPALAAKAATTTIPIVFVTGGDPVALGL